jgi:phosphoglycolate phosphatase-like HAD superfamily hydrolase
MPEVPDPDVFDVDGALVETGRRPVPLLMIGDLARDLRAAVRIGGPWYAVRTGGFSVGGLREAGALDVVGSPAELRNWLDDTLLVGASRRARS